jgi:hypothetical protein
LNDPSTGPKKSCVPPGRASVTAIWKARADAAKSAATPIASALQRRPMKTATVGSSPRANMSASVS